MLIDKKSNQDKPILSFSEKNGWDAWLSKNHKIHEGIWLKIAKKESGIASVTYPEALESALCHGWIDGQKKGFDEKSWLQKFTPRGNKSIWSAINKNKARQLIKEGRMKPAGLQAIENAKKDGRWGKAYESQSKSKVPPDLQTELDKSPKADVFFKTLNSANRYAILFRIQNAKKTETREKRIKKFIDMLEKGEKIHP